MEITTTYEIVMALSVIAAALLKLTFKVVSNTPNGASLSAELKKNKNGLIKAFMAGCMACLLFGEYITLTGDVGTDLISVLSLGYIADEVAHRFTKFGGEKIREG